MNATEQLAAFAAGAQASVLSPTQADNLRLHVFDTIGALVAGSVVAETVEMRNLVEEISPAGPAMAVGPNVRTTLPMAVLLSCVAARCSEVDDIHLRSCVTPGSVIVPAALAVASTLPLTDDSTFLSATLAGYEVLVRLGVAINGPQILYAGIWPTYVCAGFGVAVTAGRLLGLDPSELADALAIVTTRATGTSGRIDGRTSRWLTLGCAAHDAVLACLAARRGFRGDRSLLDGKWSAIAGIALDRDALLGQLGERFLLDEISFKPVCAGKQTIAAIYAFRELLAGGLEAASIRDLLVEVPTDYHAMIDLPAFPRQRLESLANVRYQLALAAAAPEKLLDVIRQTFVNVPFVHHFMAKVRVRADPALDAVYPQHWPARVTVTTEDGSVRTLTVVSALGDPGTGYDWNAATAKCMAMTSDPSVAEIAALCQRLGEGSIVHRLTQRRGTPPGSS